MSEPRSLSPGSVDVGDVVRFWSAGLWRVVCIRGDQIEAVAYPWAASWAAPRTFRFDEVMEAQPCHDCPEVKR